MESSIFATRMNELLQKKKIKQIELVRLAEEKGIKLGKSHISQYVSGKTVPRKDVLQFLSTVLEVEPDWLLGKEEKFNLNSRKEGSSMREFKKSTKLDNVLYDVRGPVVEEADRMIRDGTQVL